MGVMMAERLIAVLTPLRRPRVFLTTVIALGVVGAALTYVVLLNPGGTIMRLFRSVPPERFGTITIGPYPQEEDFPRLKQEGVKYIVTLLDPRLPYEKPMLERELALGAKYGITVKSFPLFPMDSMLKTEFFSGSLEEEKKAVEFLAHADGRAYVHCYLGRHRALRVRDALLKAGVSERSFTPSELDNVLSAAYEAFRRKDYPRVLSLLEPMTVRDVEVAHRRGWAYYHLGRIEEAAKTFREGLEGQPMHPRLLLGSGYCYLRSGEPVMAQREFGAVLEQIPGNRDALVGIGLAHLSLGNKAEAARLFRKVLEAYPDSREVKEYLRSAERR